MEEILLQKLLHFKYPPSQCLRCNCLQSSRIPNICDSCFAQLPRLINICTGCGNLTPKPLEVCGNCLNKSSSLDQYLIACPYQPPIDKWLRLLKDKGRTESLPLLAALISEQLHNQNNLSVDILIPVPIAWDRRILRGFNQTELLCNALCKSIGLPTSSDLLTRSRRIKSQRGLSRAERIRNQRNSFVVKQPKLIKHKNILLIDDIFTTGATAEQAARALKKAGADRVIFAAVARTPDPKD